MESLLFSPYEMNNLRPVFWKIFLGTELGQVYQSIPFEKMASPFKPFKNKSPQGVKSIFSVEGGLGLMFLKHYFNGISDSMLIEMVNTDWKLQYFCGVSIRPHAGIRDKDMVGRWRRFFAEHCEMGDWKSLQRILVDSWKGDIKQTSVSLCDAVVCESYIKYPTDVKLLWDCCEWIFEWIEDIGELFPLYVSGRALRKFRPQKDKQLAYDKKKKKSRKEELRRRKALIGWTEKGLSALQSLLDRGEGVINLIKDWSKKTGQDVFSQVKTVRTILFQQRYHLQAPKASVPDRIVSFHKPYLRPIVRGKENKRVEFGAKLHIVQVDGINLIEHFSFKAFHEGNRLPQTLAFHKKMFTDCKQLGADAIYATNKNRKLCSKKGITTSFKPKGKEVKDPIVKEQTRLMRSIIGKARATALEGSFGNEKNHYGLHKVKARKEKTEILWIFFGVHTANAVAIAKRRAVKKEKSPPPKQHKLPLAA